MAEALNRPVESGGNTFSEGSASAKLGLRKGGFLPIPKEAERFCCVNEILELVKINLIYKKANN